jgi:predicted nucleotidyltransferase
MLKGLKSLIVKLKKAVIAIYGERLVSCAIFGSVGRRTATSESDIDILIIADNLPRGRMARVKEFEKVEEVLAKDLEKLNKKRIYLSLSPVIKTKEEVLFGSPLFLDMIDDALIIFDRNKFFNDYLEKFKDRLNGLGAKKINLGSYWYWILKSDYKLGEVFEI